MKAISITIPFVREYVLEKRMRHFVLMLIGFCAFGYVYFVSTSVLNIIARKDAHTQITQVESAIGTLESEYFYLSSAISQDAAKDLGLVPVLRKNFVTRTSIHASAKSSSNTGL
jgi:hypothetical protein